MRLLLPLIAVFVLTPPLGAAPPLQQFLEKGQVAEGLAAYEGEEAAAAKFSLALLQVLNGVQDFSRGFQALGIRSELAQSGLPFLRMVTSAQGKGPVETATPAGVTGLFLALKASLVAANATLASIGEEPFTVEVDLADSRLDFDHDGKVAPEETLLTGFGRLLAVRHPEADKGLPITFDSADAAWLEGYTHVVIGMIDLLTAYDWMPVWNQSAHVVFEKPDPVPPIAEVLGPDRGFGRWADYIAAIHDMRLPLIDPEGPTRAQERFLQMIACSRLCWQRVLAEEDNTGEWLPNPNQTGPGGAEITQQEIDGWLEVLDEMEAVAVGKKLLPHWRFKPALGINVDALVRDPPPLDLVLILQGSALLPYVEEGAVSDAARWRELRRPFGRRFWTFAIWSN